MMKTGIIVLVLLATCKATITTAPFYDFLRNVTMGVVTGFEGPKYVFPTQLCLNQTYTIALDDDIISVTMYASLQNWTAVDQYLAEAKSDFKGAVSGCDYLKVSTAVESWYANFSPADTLLKAWWNSILIYRSMSLAYRTSHTENLLANTTGHWKAMGYNLGVSLQYLVDPIS